MFNKELMLIGVVGGTPSIPEGRFILMQVGQSLSGGIPLYGNDPLEGYGSMAYRDITFSSGYVIRVMALYNRDESPRGFRVCIDLNNSIDILYVVRADTLKGLKFDETFIGGSSYSERLTKELLITPDDIDKDLKFYVHDTPPPFEWTDIGL